MQAPKELAFFPKTAWKFSIPDPDHPFSFEIFFIPELSKREQYFDQISYNF